MASTLISRQLALSLQKHLRLSAPGSNNLEHFKHTQRGEDNTISFSYSRGERTEMCSVTISSCSENTLCRILSFYFLRVVPSYMNVAALGHK
ncbi:hypothetical protein PAMP_009657 [Pampus punctatissimus]